MIEPTAAPASRRTARSVCVSTAVHAGISGPAPIRISVTNRWAGLVPPVEVLGVLDLGRDLLGALGWPVSAFGVVVGKQQLGGRQVSSQPCWRTACSKLFTRRAPDP